MCVMLMELVSSLGAAPTPLILCHQPLKSVSLRISASLILSRLLWIRESLPAKIRLKGDTPKSPQAPAVIRSCRRLEGPLCDLRLYSAPVRAALFLWTYGHPSIIVLPHSPCAATDLICRIAVEVRQESYGRVAANFRS